MASRALSRWASRESSRLAGRRVAVLASAPQSQVPCPSHGFHSLPHDATASRPAMWALSPASQSSKCLVVGNFGLQRFVFTSSASPRPDERDPNTIFDEQQTVEHDNVSENCSQVEVSSESIETTNSSKAPEKTEEADMKDELSIDDLVKLVAEKEELLKLKHKEIEKMQDKVLRSYAEMQNVIDRTKREAENSKEFAIQNFVKSLLDVADNLGRASSIVKESFSKSDTSKDTAGAVPLLVTPGGC